MTKRSAITVLMAAWLAAGVSMLWWAPAGAAGQADLAQLRQATAKFHDLGATLASGRVDLHLCVDQSQYGSFRVFHRSVTLN